MNPKGPRSSSPFQRCRKTARHFGHDRLNELIYCRNKKCQNRSNLIYERKRFWNGLALEPVPGCCGLVLLIAVPAIYRPALGRFEWNLGLYSAIGALYVMHLSRAVISAATKSTGSRFSVHYYYLLVISRPATFEALGIVWNRCPSIYSKGVRAPINNCLA